MFALLAFFGDIGCSLGPGMVGFLSDAFNSGKVSMLLFHGSASQQGLKFGLMFAIIFPLVLAIAICIVMKIRKKRHNLA